MQMMRVRFCLEAAEKPSYPAAYGILSMCMWSCAPLILALVASLDNGLMGNVSRWSRPRAALCVAGRRDGLREASLRLVGAAPLPARARRLSSPVELFLGGRAGRVAGRPPVRTLVSSRCLHVG